MKITVKIDERDIEITTEHSASSYNQPIVLVDGELTDFQAHYERDECGCSILGLLADAAGVWGGRHTREKLLELSAEMLPENPTGADYDKVIAEFKRRKDIQE